MRETYSTLMKTTQDFCVDPSVTSTTALTPTKTFLSNQVNNTIQYLYQKIRNYKTKPLPKTMSTVADQIYYHYPPGLINIQEVTMTVGDINYPLRVINSQSVWNDFQQVNVTASTIPQYIFPRQYDFGIYPTPQDAYTVTLVGDYLPQRLTVDDYNTGTVSVTQNSTTVTGTDTVFTADMVGRWFNYTTTDTDPLLSGTAYPSGNWYKIASFTSTTEIDLQTYYEESTITDGAYVIGQSPEIPEELHEYIPYRASASYYSALRRDPEQGQRLINYFYTGDFYNTNRTGHMTGGTLGIISRYKNEGRSGGQINYTNKSKYNLWHPLKEAWGTTLS